MKIFDTARVVINKGLLSGLVVAGYDGLARLLTLIHIKVWSELHLASQPKSECCSAAELQSLCVSNKLRKFLNWRSFVGCRGVMSDYVVRPHNFMRCHLYNKDEIPLELNCKVYYRERWNPMPRYFSIIPFRCVQNDSKFHMSETCAFKRAHVDSCRQASRQRVVANGQFSGLQGLSNNCFMQHPNIRILKKRYDAGVC